MSLGKTLKQEMPVERVRAECGECGMEFFDSAKSREDWPMVVGDIIEMKARAHRNESGHDDAQVNIQKRTQTVNKIDCEITVSGT